MKTSGVLLAWVILGFSITLAQPASKGDVYSGVRVDGYPGDTYTTRNRADYNVFFTGEPIRLAVVVGNGTEDARWLQLPAEGAPPFDVAVTRDDRPIDVRVRVDRGFAQRRVGGVEYVEGMPTFRLAGKEELTWPLTIDEPLPPGMYDVQVTVHATQRGGGAIVSVHPTVGVELRPADSAPVEVARRQALRTLGSGDLVGAERTVRALLKLHPTSFEAAVMLGRIAHVRGAMQDARSHFANALALLDSGDDGYLRRYRSPAQIESIRQAVESLARRTP